MFDHTYEEKRVDILRYMQEDIEFIAKLFIEFIYLMKYSEYSDL